MSNDVWKAKLERGERLPPDEELTEYVLKTIGISPNKVKAVLDSLLAQGRETWADFWILRDEAEAIQIAGDDLSGRKIWSFVQDQKAKAKAAGKFDKIIC